MTVPFSRKITYDYDRLFPHFFLEDKLHPLLPHTGWHPIKNSRFGNNLTVLDWQDREVRKIYSINKRLKVKRLDSENEGDITMKSRARIIVQKFIVQDSRSPALRQITDLITMFEDPDLNVDGLERLMGGLQLGIGD